MGKINEKYFKDLLLKLGFTENDDIFKGIFGTNDYELKVDFNKKEIDYGETITVKSKEICNFNQSENMVVLECVSRLLAQGYEPESFVLEPRWKVGHGASGGKADILINDKNSKSYLIIECKIWSELEKFWKTTLQDGGQLFSYYQQDNNTKFVSMYASQLNSDNIEHKYYLVNLVDNDDYLNTLGRNIHGYKDANSSKEMFEIWKDVYNQDYEERGIFENNLPYDVGKTRFSINDLEDVTSSSMYESDKKFKNILRQHNIGSHENAFDKLVNLFLAKIVDEKNNPKDLQFNWKGISKDDVKSLIDRLQKLYKTGMKSFLNEEVTYVDKKDIDDAFRFLQNDKDAIKETILQYFDILKYYTNNDFAFLDVHNEDLFKQNSQVLLKIVQMLQNLKLTTKNHNQFLGDLFEGFLDNGVKQSEGQYFTPLPIVRFIVSSLPLKSLVENNSSNIKMIDYACGAGHFLNEYANQISTIDSSIDSHEFYKNIYGIEKEYRLSKVSKVSAFMYSQDEINIIYDDALKHSRVKDNSFNVLISNPPYSVKGFLETLDDDEREKFNLYKFLNKKQFSTNRNIETFFVERAKQLLVSDGIAAIILPASFLTNPRIFIEARKIIIENFDIISIAEFASGTFGKTGTPTVTLFLRRKHSKPDLARFARSRVNAWYSNNFDTDFEYFDNEIFNDFCKFRNIDIASFISDPKQYESEKEKLIYFYIISKQKNPVLIVKSPIANRELKRFLGYEWKNRDKSFKINYLGTKNINNDDDDFDDKLVTSKEGIDKISTPLFNPKNLYDDTKINKLIRDNFDDKPLVINENLSDYVTSVKLIDLIKFDGKKFDLQINTTPSFKMESKYELDKLEKYVSINKVKQIQANELEDIIVEGAKDIKLLPSSKDYDWWTTKSKGQQYVNEGEVITIGQARYANIKYFNGKYISANNIIINSLNEEKFITKYLYHLFSVYSKHFYKRTGQYPAFDRDLFYDFQMPIIPKDIQKKIIKECDEIDNLIYDNNKKIIENLNRIIEIISSSNTKKYKVDFVNDFEYDTGLRVVDSELSTSGSLPVISANVDVYFGWIDKDSIIDNFDSDFVVWPLDGDWKTRYILANNPFYPTDHCGWLRNKNINQINLKYFRYVLDELGRKEMFSRTKRPTIERLSSLDIRLPSIEIQNSVVEKITKYENIINDLQKQIEILPIKKSEIINKYIL